MFRSYGHEKSSIINGGLPAWVAEGLSVDGGHPPELKKTHYPPPSLDVQAVRSMTSLVLNLLLQLTLNEVMNRL